MIEDSAQSNELNEKQKTKTRLTKLGKAVFGAAIAAGVVATGVGIGVGINNQKEIDEGNKVVDSEHFTINRGDTLIQDASEAAQRLALKEKVDPGSLPSIVGDAQNVQAENGDTVYPGQGFTLEKTASGDLKIVPDKN